MQIYDVKKYNTQYMMNENPLSCLGRDILEEIALHLDNGRDRLRFSGCVSKEIKKMLWGDENEMPMVLFRGMTWVVNDGDIGRQLACGEVDTSGVLYARLLASKRIVIVQGQESSRSKDSTDDSNINSSAAWNVERMCCRGGLPDDDDGMNGRGIDLEFRGIEYASIQVLMPSVLFSLPIFSMTFDSVNFSVEHKAMVHVLRHGAFQELKRLHLKNISVVLSSRDSLCHLESLENIIIDHCFVSLEQGRITCLPSSLRRIELVSSTCTVSTYEWIRLCGTQLAHSCEELILKHVTCCHHHHSFHRGADHIYTGSLDLSACQRLERIVILNSYCYRACCMPHGVTLVLNNDCVKHVDIDSHTTLVDWMMPCPGSLRQLRIRGDEWKRRFGVEDFRSIQLPYLQELDFDLGVHHQQYYLEDIIHPFRGSLERLILRRTENSSDIVRLLNTVVRLVQEYPDIKMVFL